MNNDDVHSRESPAKIHVGMTFDEVCAALGGPPDGTNPGSEMLGGKGEVTGIFTSPSGVAEMRSSLFFTKFCVWRRLEGDYFLTFVHDRLERVTNAPDGAVVKRPESTKRRLPTRFVLLVTDGSADSPLDVLNTMFREGELVLHPEALTYGEVDAEMAIDLPLERVIAYGLTRALMMVEKKGKDDDFLDTHTCTVKRFRRARGPGSAGVLLTIAGPSDDPNSFHCVKVESEGRRDVCGKCGITEKERLKEWNAPAPRGVVKIGNGDRGAFMYCEQCRRGICGRCSIDLGMSAGCPLCQSELVYMDGGRQ